MFRNLHHLSEVCALTGGLTVVGSAILAKKMAPVRLDTAMKQTVSAKPVPSSANVVASMSTRDLQPGFLLKVPTVNKSSAAKPNSHVNQNPEFMERINSAILKSKQPKLAVDLQIEDLLVAVTDDDGSDERNIRTERTGA